MRLDLQILDREPSRRQGRPRTSTMIRGGNISPREVHLESSARAMRFLLELRYTTHGGRLELPSRRHDVLEVAQILKPRT